MRPYFRDEVRIQVAQQDGHGSDVNNESGSGTRFYADDTSPASPLLSSRTSSSSATEFELQDPLNSHHNDLHGRSSRASGSSETLVGNFIASHFPSLKNKLPTTLAGPAYGQLPSGYSRPTSRRLVHRKKTVCAVLLLAALMLGIGGRHVYRSKEPTKIDSWCSAGDLFCPSLHDQDSLQDASIAIPTIARPDHPSSAEDVLPFDLHHNDTVTIAPLAPALSAANRRQLHVVPSQRPWTEDRECLDAWITHGTVCESLSGVFRKQPDLTNVDMLYSWVNGSDWRHTAAKWMHGYRPHGRWQEYVEEDLFPSAASSQQQTTSPQRAPRSAIRESESKLTRRSGAALQSRFRDHQELRFSMRTAAKHLRGLSTIHIVAPDFSAPYHLQPGAHQPDESNEKSNSLLKLASSLRRRLSRAPFMLNVDRLNEAFLGLPSQLRRRQGLGTDRFTTDEGQIREGQVPQWMSIANGSIVLSGQEAATPVGSTSVESFSSSLSRLFSSPSPSSSSTTQPKVRLHHDWNIFTDNWLVTHALTDEERQHRDDYRRAALPTFNSMAVESMLGDQPGLQDTFVYSNDDFFFVDDASTGDISSPLFGPVFRLDYNLLVEGKRSADATPGEWSSLWHTNWLLDQRFGKRKRPYIQHVHKSFSKSLLLETRMGWAYEHAQLGTQRFRNGGDNLVTHFLTYYNMVERHREALLWSFFMLRLDGDGDGLVSLQELERALSQMGLTTSQAETALSTQTERNLSVAVRLGKRTTLKDDSANAALIQAGWPVPLKSRYAFTSQDGYPLGKISDRVIYRRSNMQERYVSSPSSSLTPARGETTYFGWPDFVDDPSLHANHVWHNQRFERTACDLDLDRCFLTPFAGLRSGTVGWEDVFKQFAFVDGACGDCLIHHLVAQSGERGLGAFLPPSERAFDGPETRNPHLSEQVPHLPLTSVWNASTLTVDPAFEPESPCFSTSCVLSNSGFGQGTSLRLFAAQLIQRYSYTIAESPIAFKQLETRYNSDKVMAELEASMKRPSALDRFKLQHSEGEAGDWMQSQSSIDDKRLLFACINDDILDRWVDSVGETLTKWMAKMWVNKEEWEL
ncbi:EF-hand domain-containing protein [Pseudozyma hubeiensis]|nr:EF-hand domain-containing protein [Pseudozyma hubeiensis]